MGCRAEGVSRAVHQHAAGCVRGLAPGFAPLYKQNCRASLAQCYGKGEADNASADHDYVPSLHSRIVKDAERVGRSRPERNA